MNLTVTGLVELAIAITLAEALVLWAYHRRTRRGLAPREFLPTLVAGLALMAAARAAFGPQPAALEVGVWLFVAGAAHVSDLLRRRAARAS